MAEAGSDRMRDDGSPACATPSFDGLRLRTARFGEGRPARFRPFRVILAVLAAMLAVSAYANWYAQVVSLPRYCENPEEALRLLESVMTQDRPAGEANRRPYLIAAKLLYLIPQEEGESLGAYQARLRKELVDRCR